MPCILLWAAYIYCSIVFLHNVMYGPQCLASACKKTFRDTGVHLMPLAQKIETTCSKTMATEPTATLQCKSPKMGSALMMNHSDHLHCNTYILGQRTSCLPEPGKSKPWILVPDCFTTHLNIILTYTSKSPYWPLNFRFHS